MKEMSQKTDEKQLCMTGRADLKKCCGAGETLCFSKTMRPVQAKCNFCTFLAVSCIFIHFYVFLLQIVVQKVAWNTERLHELRNRFFFFTSFFQFPFILLA